MRALRVASILPLLSLLAGCVTTEEPGSLKSGQTVFPGEDQETIQLASELALGEALERPDLFRGVEDMAVERVNIEAGEAHARLVQMVGGVPVFQGEAVVHLGTDGKFNSVNDKFVRDIQIDVNPKLKVAEATDAAVIASGGADMLLAEPKADMQVLRHEGKDHLTYRVQLEMRTVDDDPSMPVVFVDAHTGEVVWSYDNLQSARNRNTYTGKNRTTLPGTLVRNEASAPVADAVVNAGHDGAGHVYDYYKARHNRDSFDNTGATITSTVHHKANYVNAFWNGTQMVYGDGDGVQSGPLTVLDVIGHEITHAVTERSSNLTYANESGALNEAMSDIFGAAIEAYRDGAVTGNTWKIGEECWTPGTAGDALRYMNNPGLAGDFDYYPTRYTGTSDNGGVHWNSGIANLAFHLAVAGGAHPAGKTSNNVPALDSDPNVSIQKGAAIFYQANTQCLTAGSTFTDARDCTQQAASALYGTSALDSITQAWIAVGVPSPLAWTAIDSKSNLSASKSQQLNYSYAVASGTKAFRVSIAGNNGDADLYVKYGSAPTTASYTCRSAGANSNEGCTINPAQSGTYYVMIHAYTAYTGLSMTVSTGN
jgi:Zn-dependent metalloprotease